MTRKYPLYSAEPRTDGLKPSSPTCLGGGKGRQKLNNSEDSSSSEPAAFYIYNQDALVSGNICLITRPFIKVPIY